MSSSVGDVKSPSDSSEAGQIMRCTEDEASQQSIFSFSSSQLLSWNAEVPVADTFLTSPDTMTNITQHSAGCSDFTSSATQRHVDCPGCAPRHVVYHTCNLPPHEPFHEYQLSPGSCGTDFTIASLQRQGGEGTLTYSAQSPVSVTHVHDTGHLHSTLPYGYKQVAAVQSPPYQRDCPCCSTTLEKRNEIDRCVTVYGDQLPLSGSTQHFTGPRQFVSGADVPRPCPVHGSESFLPSFNPTYDIPLTLTYSDVASHPYLPRYYIQQSHHHRHQHPVPAHQQGLPPYAQYPTGHHHCCSHVFQDGMHDGRCQIPSYYDPKMSLIRDDPFHANVSAESPRLSQYLLHRDDDPQSMTSPHSVGLPESHVIPHGCNTGDEDPNVGLVANVEAPGDVHLDESCAKDESVRFGHEIKDQDMLIVSTDVTEDSVHGAVAEFTSDDVTVKREAFKSESFVCDIDGSSVDGNRMLRSDLNRFSTDVMRSHTPPERDSNSLKDKERGIVPNAEEDVTVPSQEMPSARGMAFTIDFGNNLDSPEITENWKQFTPYRIHAGIQERASKTKHRLHEKSESLEGDRYQKKRSSLSGISDRDQNTKVRSGSPGSKSVGGYVSDGHASGISSDNEGASLCSEMIGCMKGRRKFLRSSDHPNRLVDGPSKSNTKVKSSSDHSSRPVRPVSSGASGYETKASKPSRTLPSTNQISDKPKSAVKKAVDTRQGVIKNTMAKTDSPLKRGVKPSKGTSENVPSRRLPKRPCDDGLNEGKDEEILDVTSYLINRMLSSSDKASNGYKSKSRPSSGGGGARGSSGATQCLASDSKRRQQNENIPDNVSETGTYTIEDDTDTSEVQKARKDIDVLFGVDDPKPKPDRIVRPVIEGAEGVSPDQPEIPTDLTTNTSKGEGDVFEYEPDMHLQEEFKLQVSEAVSSAISATKAIQKALLQKSSRSHKSSGADDERTDPSTSFTSLPSNVNDTDDLTSSFEPQSATESRDATDEKDFGTFSISFDAPSPRLGNSGDLSLEESSTRLVKNCDEEVDGKESHTSLQTPDEEDEEMTDQSLDATDVQMMIQSVDATVQHLHDQLCKRTDNSKASHNVKEVSSRTLQKPTREATFVKETRPNAAFSRPGQLRSTSAKNPPSSSGSGQWHREYEASDCGSESETASLSSMDYSTMSSKFGRATLLRSSGSKGSLPAPRVNRTFALRCSKASGNESESTVSLVPRSRSAGTDSRLSLHEASSRTTSQSRSRARILSPASDISRSNQVTSRINQSRRRDLEQQHSEDSSASICSSISSRGSSTFVRKDGGRYSMRTEKSSYGTTFTSANRTRDKKVLKPKSAGSQPSSTGRDRPGSGGSTSSQRPMTAAQEKEFNAWKRRKQYDPRKAVAEARTKDGSRRTPKHDNGSQSEPDDSSTMTESFISYDDTHAEETARADEIAQLSNAVAYNLNVLAESTKKDSVTLDELRLQQLPVFSCDSNSRSAFSALRISGSHKTQSMPLVTSDRISTVEDQEKGSYDTVLVSSIQQVSRKVKVLTDQLITKVRDEKRRGASADAPLVSPLGGGANQSWENASPELTSILENLKRTEQHLQVVHKAIFPAGAKGRGRGGGGGGTETQRHQTIERQRAAVAERGGFKPIERPTSGSSSVKKRSSTAKKQPYLCTNPLSGDEYY